MKSGKFVTLPETTNEQDINVSHEIELRQGDWVEVFYEGRYTGHTIEIVNRKYRVKCLYKSECNKWWKLESDRNAVWYHQSDIIGRPTNEPKMHCCDGLYYY